MRLLPKDYISDARKFQRHGEYDLAIESLKNAQLLDLQQEYEVEIQKLLSFNYRKIKKHGLALFHISNAIRINKLDFEQTHKRQAKADYAICLMNQGVIYEEMNSAEKAIACYLSALEIFTELFDTSPENYGIIINALLTIGIFYYNQRQHKKAKEFLQRALHYFDDDQGKGRDRRYLAIIRTLSEISNKI